MKLIQTILEDTRLIDCGVDWLTLTAKHETPESEWLAQTARLWFARSAGKGIQPERRNNLAYDGHGIPGMYFGKREDGVMLQGQSSSANELMKEVRATALQINCSRMDIQGTFALESDDQELPAQLRDIVRATSKEGPKRRRPNTELIERDNKGCSIALNSRQSDLHYRFYDKNRESEGIYGGPTYRAETECKRKVAQHYFDQAMKCNSLTHFSGAVLYDTWSKRGLEIASVLVMESYENFSQYEKRTEDKSLRWLRRFVAGTIKKLIEAGKLNETLDALGLLPYVTLRGELEIGAKEQGWRAPSAVAAYNMSIWE